MRRDSVGTRPLSLLSLLLTLLFFLPAAAQQFAQPTVIPTGSWPAAIYTADINGDGITDLVYIDNVSLNQSTAHILFGDGHGGFSPGASIAVFGHALALGDFIGNGNITPVSLLLFPPGNNGCISYGIQITADLLQPSGTSNGAVNFSICSAGAIAPVLTNLTAARLHGPAAPADLLFTDSANNLLYVVNLHGNATNFASQATAVTTPIPAGDGPITVADLNSDGSLDLALIASGSITTFLGNGDGTLQSAHTFAASAPIHSILIQDVNFDGRPDLIAESTNGHIDVYPGNGDGTFDPTSIGGTGPLDGLTGNGGHLIAIADLNHDGQLDALTATPAGISTLLGAGTSYLKLGGIYNAGPGHTSYAVADFNGDGNLDLAVDSPEGIAILYGNPDGSFQTSRAYAAGAPALSAALGSLPAEPTRDIVLATGGPQLIPQAQLMLGGGDGTFSFQASTATPNLPLSIGSAGERGDWASALVTDFNQDGLYDIVLTADRPAAATSNALTPPGLSAFFGKGGQSFSQQAVSSATEAASSGPFYGVSASGPPAFPLTNLDTQSVQQIRQADPYGVLPPATFIVPEQDPHAHNLLVPLHARNQDASYLLIVQDQGSLKLVDAASRKIEGDLAVDGSLTTPGQMLAPDISGTFPGPSRALGFNAFPGSMAVANLDGNALPDLLVLYANLDADPTAPSPATPNYLYIWYGSSPGKFLTSARHPVNPVRIQLSRNYYQVAVADLNGDGIPDLILSDGYLVSYQLGDGKGTFGPEHHLLAGRGINTISTADLRGIGTQDLVLANGGAAFSNPVVNHETLAADPDVNTGGITVLLNTPTPKAAIQATLTASPEPSVFYSAYTLTFNTGGPDGIVAFSQDGAFLGTSATTNGVATYTFPAGNEVLPGSHALSGSFSLTTSPLATQATGSHTVTRAPTTITLMPTTPSTVYYGQGIDGIFNVTFVDGNYPDTGNYTLLDNGQAVAICTNIPVTQSCPYGNPILLDAGKHTLSLMYLGDAVNAPSTSPDYPFTILPDLTTLSLGTSATPAYLGQPITLTAVAAGNFATPTGTVTFSDGGQLNQTSPLASGTATIFVSNLTLGTHNVIAHFPGNIDFNSSTSLSIPQQIIPDLTTLTLTSSKNPANKSDAVTFTAAISGNYLQPTGAINFLDNGILLGSSPLTPTPGNLATATFTTSTLAVGTPPITVVYAGNASFNPAASADLNEVIQAPPVAPQVSITTITSNLNPSAPRQPVTFTAYVQVPGVFITSPTGTVAFLDGTTTLGTGTLNNFGLATLQTAALATGTHQITTSYAGATSSAAPTILPSVSQPLAQVVTIPLVSAAPGFEMTATPNTLTLGVGRTGVITVTITPVGGFNQPVALTCAHLAPETSCVFLPATVPPGGGTANLQLLTNAPRDCNTNTPYFLGSNSSPTWPIAPGAITAASLAFLALRRSRIRLAKGLLLTAFAAALTTLSGCGHCTDLGTKPGNYTFQLIGTAQGGPVTETRTIVFPLTMTIP